MAKKTKELYDEAKHHVKERFVMWSQHWRDYHDFCKEIYKEYLAETDVLSSGKSAGVKPSLGFSITENVLADTHEALFEEHPYIKTEPVYKDDVQDSEDVTDFMTYQCQKNGLRTDSIPFVRNVLMYGVGFAFVPWTVEKEMIRVEVPVTEPVMQPSVDQFGNPMLDENGAIMPPTPQIGQDGYPVMKPVIGYDGKPAMKKEWVEETTTDIWEFEPLENWDVLCDPSITNFRKIRRGGQGIIVSRYYSKDELKSLQRRGVYRGVDFYFNDLAARESEGAYSTNDEQQKKSPNWKNGKVRVLQYWGKFPVSTVINKKGQEELVYDEDAVPVECVIDIPENCSTCFRVKRNPIDTQVRPIIAVPLHPQNKSLISPGLLTIIYSEYQAYKEFINARLKNLNKQMNPMWFSRLGTLSNLRNLNYVPNKIVRMGDPRTDILPAPSPDLGATFSQDMGGLLMEMQETTGSIKAGQKSGNMGQAFARTAAGINFFQQRVDARLRMIVNVAEEGLFGGLFEIVHSYNKQFVTDEEYFKVMGKDNIYRSINPASFTKRLDWMPVDAGNRLKKGEMVQLLDRLMTSLGGFREDIRIDKILEKYVKITGLFKFPEEILLSDEEKAKIAQAKQQPQAKQSLSLSVAFEDLPTAAKTALISQFAPQAAEESRKEIQLDEVLDKKIKMKELTNVQVR